MTNPAVQVQQFGQSIWYDNIRRSLLTSGELKRMIDEDGILGVTSNPTIFQKAIGDSSDYDDAIGKSLDLDSSALFELLAIEDIQTALDLFTPVYERTQKRDGYVSLEVSPLIANDTESTITEAKRLFAAVGRPNSMIKIPATAAGIPAIEEAIYNGININVTLIFSVENYKQVIDAYIRGLERRHAAGLPVDGIASVASFFLSRIDVIVDRMLDNNILSARLRGDLPRVTFNNQLKGKTAIANAKVAYEYFVDVFYGDRFAMLRGAGAMPQRVLWASTGTKNPAYADTMYLDALIGRDTVNTVPPETLKAFIDHGTAADTLTQNLHEAHSTLDMLSEVNIDLAQVTYQLQTDGVESFSESFRSLLDQVEAKTLVLSTGIMRRQEVAIGTGADAVSKALKELDNHHANTRIWAHDGTFWKDHPTVVTKINDRLGWLETDKTIDIGRLNVLAAEAGQFSHVVLLGMGGSSLAPEVLSKTFGTAAGHPTLLMLDSTDPAYIKSIHDAIDLPRSLFIVASKSGSTLETDSFYRYFYEASGNNGAQFIAITDGGSGLEAAARAANFRDVFVNPSDIGGRYSALSYFGLVPAALIGVDVERLVAAAARMMQACSAKINAKDHPGISLGVMIGVLGKDGKDKLTIQTSPSIGGLGSWIEQLVAESTGKEGRGIIPVVGATAGKPHDYSSDRVFVYLRVEGDNNAELDAEMLALQQAGHPCITLHLPDMYAIGGEFFRWEYATAIMGKLLDINPFDEPNVTESKINTNRLLAFYQEHGSLPVLMPIASENGVSIYADERQAKMLRDLCEAHHFDANTVAGLLAAQINATNAGDYFALLAYLPSFASTDERLEHLRRRIRHVTHRAVTLGYGPRFLHSTGQLHKGGANNGVFFQFTYDMPFDLPIPNQPYSFGTLKSAQAAGDMESLQSKQRRAVRVHLGADVLQGLEILAAAVDLTEQRKI